MEERIRYLFRQYLENRCSREEMDELFAYIRGARTGGGVADTDRDEAIRGLVKEAYDSLQQAPSALTYVDEYGQLILTEKGKVIAPARARRAKRRLTPVLLVVLCLAGAGVAGWLIRREGRGTKAVVAALTRKNTERSEYKYLLLPDSTQVWLNASSTLEYPTTFGSDRREVLLSGEAYFDVKHADKTPFIIHTGKISTTVLGTAFNIKAYPDRKNVIVSVSRGKVRVSLYDIPVVTLEQGQQVTVNNHDNKVMEKRVAPAQVAAWQQGNLSYEDEDLEDIVADLERLYNVHIRIDNAAVRSLKVNASFRREGGVEQALEVLCRLTDTELKQENGWYILL